MKTFKLLVIRQRGTIYYRVVFQRTRSLTPEFIPVTRLIVPFCVRSQDCPEFTNLTLFLRGRSERYDHIPIPFISTFSQETIQQVKNHYATV